MRSIVLACLILSLAWAEPPKSYATYLERQVAADPWARKHKWTLNSGTIVVGQHRVAIKPEGAKESHKTIVGVHFEITLDGVPIPQLTYGSVGTGKSLAEAREAACNLWLGGFARALLPAIAGKPALLHTGQYDVYSGVGILRGDEPKKQLPDQSKLFSILRPALGSLTAGPDWRSLDVKVGLNEKGVDCQVILDGRDAPELKKPLLREKWPPGIYLYKVAYVLKRSTVRRTTSSGVITSAPAARARSSSSSSIQRAGSP